MKTSLRLESAIEVYRDRIIIPRQVANISDNGSMKISYSATVINEEDIDDVFDENIHIERSTFDSTIQEIKSQIDIAIAKREAFLEEQSKLPRNIVEVMEVEIKKRKQLLKPEFEE